MLKNGNIRDERVRRKNVLNKRKAFSCIRKKAKRFLYKKKKKKKQVKKKKGEI